MAELLAKAVMNEYNVDSKLQGQLQQVCSTTAWGYREIVLVIGLAKLIDPSFAPTSHLYDCNPRALFEGPIRDVLREASIPHRKSGPLNIAKATAGLNETWAAQRRPREVAMITVEIASIIETSNDSQVRNILTALLHLLLQEASRVQSLDIEIPAESDINYLSHLCFMLIDSVPAGGNTPEYIVGLLLETYHDAIDSKVSVTGHTTGASTTSTTSKKPADIIEQKSDGKILAAYEVTMKPFDEQRVHDSRDTIDSYIRETGQAINEMIVICRDQDVHPDAQRYSLNQHHLGTLVFGGIVYQFFEIHHWVAAALSRVSPLNRVDFYKRLNVYISSPSTSEQVKQYWKELHDNES